MRTRRSDRPAARVVLRPVAVGVLLVALAGCGAAVDDPPTPPRPSTGTTPSSTPRTSDPAVPPVIPADGQALAALGYTNGPVATFSLPRTAVLSARVDQADNVTAVLSSPSAAEVATYLRRVLPPAGYLITEDVDAPGTAVAMTFTGHGWEGRFTGDDRAAAVLLRPS